MWNPEGKAFDENSFSTFLNCTPLNELVVNTIIGTIISFTVCFSCIYIEADRASLGFEMSEDSAAMPVTLAVPTVAKIDQTGHLQTDLAGAHDALDGHTIDHSM